MNTYNRLTMKEREEISRGIWAAERLSAIAERIGRSPSTVSREVWRDVSRKPRSYSAVRAHERATVRARRGRPRKLEHHPILRTYVYLKLKEEWSPEEIAERLKLDYPQDMTMRASHETIYQHLYCLPKGELKRELMRGLRRERKRRLRSPLPAAENP
jgi:transposase, IS30 family